MEIPEDLAALRDKPERAKCSRLSAELLSRCADVSGNPQYGVVSTTCRFPELFAFDLYEVRRSLGNKHIAYIVPTSHPDENPWVVDLETDIRVLSPLELLAMQAED